MTQTIALIDDDRNILTSISIALEKEGFKVTYLDVDEDGLINIQELENLLEKQKQGKKKMKQIGKVSIPQDAFLKYFSSEE